MTTIDLNCDLGENPATADTDAALLEIVTSANIASGGHAGDTHTMTQAIRAAIANGAAVGAHPSYPDRANFGRIALSTPLNQLEQSLTDQIAALHHIAQSLGTHVTHIKPHGALYHATSTDPAIANTVARAALNATSATSPTTAPILIAQAGAPALTLWQNLGFRTVAEAFADRRYETDGSLRSRTLPGALIDDPNLAAQQALHIAQDQGALDPTGASIPITAQTICIHSDTPNSLTIARAVRAALEHAGIRLAPLTTLNQPSR